MRLPDASAPRLNINLRRRSGRLRNRAISAAAIDDEHTVDAIAWKAAQRGADRSFLVWPGDDGADMHRQRLHRRPQLVQGFGGASLISAPRNCW